MGDRAGAVSTYHHCASVLERELGVEPDPVTRATLNRLLARAGPAGAATPDRRPARTVRAGRRFVGRAPELASCASGGAPRPRARRARAGARRPRRRQVPADGRAGRRGRRDGAVVADAQCFGTSGRLALAPVADWLRTPAVERVLPRSTRCGGPRWSAWCPDPDPRRAGAARAAGDGRRLAAPPLLRGPHPGAARGRPARPADARQPAVVRPGDAGLHHLLPRPRRGRARPAGRDDCGTITTTSPSGPGSSGCARRASSPRSRSARSRSRTPPRSPRPSPGALTAAEAVLLHATTGGFPLYIVEAGRAGAGVAPRQRPAGVGAAPAGSRR